MGRYSDELGTDSPCTQCPPGRFGAVEGLTSATCSGSDGTGFVCPPGYTFFNDGNHDRACFKLFTGALQWNDAEAACAADVSGGHLASVSSTETIEFLWAMCVAGNGGTLTDIDDTVCLTIVAGLPVLCSLRIFAVRSWNATPEELRWRSEAVLPVDGRIIHDMVRSIP